MGVGSPLAYFIKTQLSCMSAVVYLVFIRFAWAVYLKSPFLKCEKSPRDFSNKLGAVRL